MFLHADLAWLQVRIMFEVQDLKYATLATVSRCGMVWFSEDVLSTEMIYENFLLKLRHVSVEESDDDVSGGGGFHARGAGGVAAPGGAAPTAADGGADEDVSPTLQIQRDCASILQPYFAADGLVNKCMEYGVGLDHVMDFTRLRALGTLFSMINQSVRNVIAYNASHPDFPMQVRAWM